MQLKQHLGIMLFWGEDGHFYKHAIIKLSERWEKIINQNGQYIIEIKVFPFI